MIVIMIIIIIIITITIIINYNNNKKFLSIEWRPWLPIRAPDPGLDPALMVNMIEESWRIRDNNNNNNGTVYS